ncbi:unnamed protein product [Schistocephalus solidus]|uniref:Uncharacterized protein n=1 Tax=Schistocephalus solidus TaxID=70667 RepID=A0A3P7CQ19_SCHSO|nr:unnamed protein product [Schistocephalus solidus]
MQKKKALIVTVIQTVGTQDSLPVSVVRPNEGVEVTKDNLLVLFRHSRQQGVQILVEFVLRRIRVRHWGSVVANDGGDLVFPKRPAVARQAIVDTQWQTGQTSHDVVPDGKGDTSIVEEQLTITGDGASRSGTGVLQGGHCCSQRDPIL